MQGHGFHPWSENQDPTGRGARPKNTIKKNFFFFLIIKDNRDFPGGTVGNNPPANAEDAGSSSGPGRSHMPWSN